MHYSALRAAAKKDLMYPPVIFPANRPRRFRTASPMWCCEPRVSFTPAILPDHVHLVIARHRYSINNSPTSSKAARQPACENTTSTPSPLLLLTVARRAMLLIDGPIKPSPPLPLGPPFLESRLDSDADIHRSIDYVKRTHSSRV